MYLVDSFATAALPQPSWVARDGTIPIRYMYNQTYSFHI